MDSSTQRIHDALQAVALLRRQRAGNAGLLAASAAVKRFQASRFRATYADLLQSPRYRTASRFFLDELYGEQDYAQRDQQFARIANAMARMFPPQVVQTAAALAEVHALTEQLDDQMSRHWVADLAQQPLASEASRYLRCWRLVADPAARYRQLDVVLELGRDLNGLTRTPGLRTLLKMMRMPARAAGLSSLQQFLESGFDAFREMRGADHFLEQISVREKEWIRSLFEDDAVTCETNLTDLCA
jgi:hypothetical protein